MLVNGRQINHFLLWREKAGYGRGLEKSETGCSRLRGECIRLKCAGQQATLLECTFSSERRRRSGSWLESRKALTQKTLYKQAKRVTKCVRDHLCKEIWGKEAKSRGIKFVQNAWIAVPDKMMQKCKKSSKKRRDKSSLAFIQVWKDLTFKVEQRLRACFCSVGTNCLSLCLHCLPPSWWREFRKIFHHVISWS